MLYIVKKTLLKIVKNHNHYVVKVKKNQPKLLENIKNTISNTRSIDYHISEQIRRGRLEIRETFLYKRENNLAKGWESISSIVYVKRYVLSKDKEHKSESFYVSDLPVKPRFRIRKKSIIFTLNNSNA